VCRIEWKHGDHWGFPDYRACSCSNSVGYYEDACIIYGIDSDACTSTHSGQMVGRATSKTQCEDIKACFRKTDFYPVITAVSEQDCNNADKCDDTVYEWRSVHSWTDGIWTEARHQNLTWRAREMIPANTWSRFLSTSQLYSIAQKAIMQMVSDAFVSETRCLIEPLLAIFNASACNCGTDREKLSGFCAGAFQQAAILAQATWFEGAGQVLKMNIATASLNTSQIKAELTARNLDFLKVGLGYISPYLNGINSAASGNRRNGVSLSCTDFEIVKNANNEVIGQVVGAAAVIEGVASSEVLLCIKIEDSETIPQCDYKYTVLDFAPGLSNNQPGLPLQASITLDKSNRACGTVSALQSSIAGSLTVWPILRTSDMAPYVVWSGPTVKREIVLSYASKDLFTLKRRNAFKESVAQVLKDKGIQVSDTDVVIIKVCDSNGCTTFVNRRRGMRRNTDSVTVEYQVQIQSGVDASAVESAVDDSTFTDSFETQMANRGETVTASFPPPETTPVPTGGDGAATTSPPLGGETDDDDDGGLGGGAIAGIVIGSLAGAGLLGAGGWYMASKGSTSGVAAPLNPVQAPGSVEVPGAELSAQTTYKTASGNFGNERGSGDATALLGHAVGKA